jgi:hypothetical protein
VVLTHLLAKDPDLGGRVDLDEHRGRAHEQHHQVGDAQVHEEDVGRVAHVLALEDDDRHHDVADDADAEDDDAEDHGGGADVVGEDGPPGHRVGAAGQVEAGVVGGRGVVFGRRRQRRQHRVGHFVVGPLTRRRPLPNHPFSRTPPLWLSHSLATLALVAAREQRDAVSTDDRVALTREQRRTSERAGGRAGGGGSPAHRQASSSSARGFSSCALCSAPTHPFCVRVAHILQKSYPRVRYLAAL